MNNNIATTPGHRYSSTRIETNETTSQYSHFTSTAQYSYFPHCIRTTVGLKPDTTAQPHIILTVLACREQSRSHQSHTIPARQDTDPVRAPDGYINYGTQNRCAIVAGGSPKWPCSLTDFWYDIRIATGRQERTNERTNERTGARLNWRRGKEDICTIQAVGRVGGG